MSRILVVDDKELMRDSVSTTLVRKGHTAVAVATAEAALKKLTERSFDAVITDLQMPDRDGLDLLGDIRTIDEQMPVVLMTAYGTVETAVAALKQGAYDYITKPFSGDELLLAVERAIDHGRLVRENQILRAVSTPRGEAALRTHELIGSSETMKALHDRLERIADSYGTVLISGESGAGKEVAARWIHEHSPRRESPMLALNCAALSTNLLESELFGHEKGAFTGADKLRKGRFELADGGTLLLDEISEIAPEIQAKLLRVLQERTFERVGSSTSRGVDVRVIATTNRDLPAEVNKGTFRQDLFYRLNVLPLPMPLLREHLEDIPELVQHFLKEVAEREGRGMKQVEPDAIALMQRYDWPGNVRELQNIIERASVLARGEVIEASLIEPWLPDRGMVAAITTPASFAESRLWHGDGLPVHTASTSAVAKPASMIEASPMPGEVEPPCPRIICDGTLTLDEIERETIISTLRHNKGHRQKSAKALGIGVRTLGLKLKKWKDLNLIPESL